MADKLISASEYCRQKNINRKTFEHYKERGFFDGCWRRKKGGKRKYIVASKADAALEKYKSESGSLGGQANRARFKKAPTKQEYEQAEQESGISGGLSRSEAERVLKNYQAMTAKLEYDRAKGELVERKVIEDQAAECAVMTKEAIMAIPDRLAGVLAAETNDVKVRNILEKEIRAALDSISDAL